MNNTLHQINVSYVDKEDRLLLRTTTQSGEEYRVWLTRRFTTLLFEILNKELDKKGGVVSIGSRQQTRDLFKSGALEKDFQSDKTTNYPLGEKGILAFAIKTNTSSKDVLHLQILPEKGRGITLNLNQSLTYMLHNLISQGVARAGWQLSTAETQISAKVH